MNTDRPTSERSSPVTGAGQERSDEIRRPVARRMPGLPSRAAMNEDNGPTLTKSGNSNTTSADQRPSSFIKYHVPASSSSPHRETAIPPPDTEATLATQAAAQQLWESHAAAESDQTASTTPPPESPPHATVTTATTSQPAPQQNTMQAMLSGLGNMGNLTHQQAMQLQEVYLKTLKAALASHGGMPMAPVEAALAAHAAGSTAPVDSAPEVAKQEEEEPPANGVSAADGTLTRPKAERAAPAPANGTLAILPEAPKSTGMSFPEAQHSAPPAVGRMPPPSPFHPPHSGAQASQAANLAPQQMVELLGEVLRAQTAGSAALQQSSLPQEQPPLVMNNSSVPFPNYRYNSQEASYGPAPAYSAGMDADSYNKMTARRWNSCASLASDSSLYNSAAGSFGNHNSLPAIPQNLTGAESQALLQALQQKYQASEMESMANITIQAILAGSASREAHGMRKRKLPDIYEEQKRHHSVLSEGDTYPYVNGQPQICTECGTNSTPTWRRSGKRLMCNACGLRRSRSMRSSRSASIPVGAQSVGPLDHPMEEPKMHAAI